MDLLSIATCYRPGTITHAKKKNVCNVEEIDKHPSHRSRLLANNFVLAVRFGLSFTGLFFNVLNVIWTVTRGRGLK